MLPMINVALATPQKVNDPLLKSQCLHFTLNELFKGKILDRTENDETVALLNSRLYRDPNPKSPILRFKNQIKY